MSLSFRTALALAISVAVHGALVAGFAGVAVFRGWQVAKTVDIELVSVETKTVEQLPFGPPPPPPGSARRATAGRRARGAGDDAVKISPVKVARADAGGDARGGADAGDGGAPDAGVPGPDGGDAAADGRDGGVRRPRDHKLTGPAGSRLSAVVRLDRLRTGPDAAANIAAVDGLLRHLPDRRRLLDGTGLDLYRDFDALFIATPNPLDDAVTFLVARHRLPDEAMKAALGKGAEQAGRPITWTEEGGRPVGVRAARPVELDPTGQPLPRRIDRDDRIFVLPQRGLIVMAPPAYAQVLLARGRPVRSDGGAPSAPALRWRELVARIDAEDGAMAEDAILMMSATNLVTNRGRRAGDGPLPLEGLGQLTLPGFATMQAGVVPGPYLELVAEFDKTEEAAAWAAAWPRWKQTLLASPLLLLSGFSPIVARADLQQEDNAVILRTHGTGDELRRLLGTIANLLGPRGR